MNTEYRNDRFTMLKATERIGKVIKLFHGNSILIKIEDTFLKIRLIGKKAIAINKVFILNKKISEPNKADALNCVLSESIGKINNTKIFGNEYFKKTLNTPDICFIAENKNIVKTVRRNKMLPGIEKRYVTNSFNVKQLCVKTFYPSLYRIIGE